MDIFKKNKISNAYLERLRQLFDDELTAEEKAALLMEIKSTPTKAKVYQVQKNIREDLNLFSKTQPSPQVWRNIQSTINEEKIPSSWIPFFNLSLDQIAFAKVVTIFFMITTLSLSLWTLSPVEQNYQIITVNEVQDYQSEADAYLARHVVSAEDHNYQQSLVAYYYGSSE